MISAALYITSDEAKVFEFRPEGVQTHHLRQHGAKHPAESLGKNHPKAGGDADRFFHEVAEFMGKSGTQQWLVMGPGVAKSHFQHHVEKHHSGFAKRIVGVETIDKGTDGELKNFAHDYFKKLGLFQ